ncbi:MAG: hypothetical protein IJM37_04135 [Lachnospiraceae bacterium]|nr:hypothetical protein [Lachnospiraceae bacterium]
MKKRILSIILCILMLTTVFSDYDRVPARRAEAASVLTNSTSSRTKQEIINKYIASQPSYNYSNSIFSATPSLTSPYNGGALNSGVISDVLKQINYFRWLAGTSDVSTYSDRMVYNQAGSVLMSYYNTIAHSLPKPSNMGTSFYSQASDGIGAGQLTDSNNRIWHWTGNVGYLGRYPSWPQMYEDIKNYVDDTKNQTAGSVGHRLSILDYKSEKTSFGCVQKTYNGFNDLYDCVSMYYYESRSTSNDKDYYAWPSAGYFPVESINPDALWSIRLNEKYEMTSSLTAQLSYNGNTYAAAVNRSIHADNNAFTITLPSSLKNLIVSDGMFKDGVNVTLNVSGIKETSTGSAKTISHTVRFFLAQEIKPTSVNVYQAINESSYYSNPVSNLTLNTGDTCILRLEYSPSDSTNKGFTPSYSTSGVVSCSNYTAYSASLGVKFYKLTASQAGTTIVTFRSDADSSVSKSITVTVNAPHTHDYSTYVSTTNGVATFKCSCGATTTKTVPTTINVYRVVGSTNSTLASSYTMTVGDTFDFKVYSFSPSGAVFGDMKVKITSGSSYISYTETSSANRTGRFTMTGAGTATVKIYPEYNEAAAKTVTFTINPAHTHNYSTYVSTTNGVATFRCSCGETTTKNAPTSITVYKVVGSTNYILNSAYTVTEGDTFDFKVSSYLPSDAVFGDMKVKITSGSSYITYSETSSANRTGRFTMKAAGTATVKIYPEYNEAAGKTITFTINPAHTHNYSTYVSTTNGVATLRCSCGETTTVTAPATITVFKMSGNSGISVDSSYNMIIGDTFDFMLSCSPSSAQQGQLKVVIQNSSVISYTASSTANNRGTLTMLSAGTTTVKIYPEYNPSESKTITFTVTPPHTHDYTFVSLTDGIATVRCSCGDEMQVNAPTTQSVYFYRNGSSVSAKSLMEGVIGEVYDIYTYAYPSGSSEGAIAVEISNPSVASFEKTTQTRGKLTLLSKGTTIVRVYQKYNPEVYNEYTFDVDTHAHNYVWQSTENNVATFKCSTCNKEKQENAPTSLSPYMYLGSTYVSLSGGEVKLESYKLYYSVGSNYDLTKACDVTISDSSIATFTPVSNSYGNIEFVNTGEVTVTISVKYNPTVKRTYTLYASNCEHDYKWNRTVDNVGISKCSNCGHEKNMSVPTSMNLCRVEDGSNYWIPDTSSYNKNIGDTFDFIVSSFYPSSAPTGRLMVDISDDSIVSYTPASTDDTNKEGTLTMLAGGTATVRIYPEYNEGAAKTITFNVHEHDYTFVSMEDGVATLRCSCGEEKQVNAPTYQSYSLYKNGSYVSYNGLEECVIGDVYSVYTYISPSNCEGLIAVEISDPSVASFERTSVTRGNLTITGTGTTTVRVYQKYNPELYKEYTFDADTHAHNYVWQGTENNVATFKCTTCNKERQVDAPTYISPFWYYNGGSSSTSVPAEGDILKGSYELYVYTNNSSGMAGGFDVTISDSSVATFTPTSKSYGMIDFVNNGEVTITFYAKYNPTVTRTYTLYASDCEHDYSWNRTVDNVGIARCSLCGHEKNMDVPTTMNLYRVENGSNYWISDSYSYNKNIGDTFSFKVTSFNPSSAPTGRLMVDISDDSIVSYTPASEDDSNREGTLTMLAGGTATVRIYPEYNEGIAKTITFNVHEHSYEWYSTTGDVATLKCGCGDTKQINVPTEITVGWRTGENTYTTNTPSEQQETGSTLKLVVPRSGWGTIDNGVNKEVVIEISDTNVVSFTLERDEWSSYEGTLTMLATGTATVKVYPKYNPEIAETFTFTVVPPHVHDYEFVSFTDGWALARCSCGAETNIYAPYGHCVYVTSSNTSAKVNDITETVIGESFNISAYSYNTGADCTIMAEISDPSVAVFERTGWKTGRLRMLSKGVTTVKIYQRYNPSVCNEYTFDVDTHYHDYEWQGTENNVATFKCSTCDKERQVDAPTYVNTYWYHGDPLSVVNIPTEGDILRDSYELRVYTDNAYNMASGFEVSISDSDIATYTPVSDTKGTIDFIGNGEVTITVYVKYNPEIKKTFKFYASDCTHDYQWNRTVDNVGIARCSLCGHEQNMSVPTSIDVYKLESDNTLSTLSSSYENKIGDTFDFRLTGYSPSSASFGRMMVDISDNNVVSYTPASEDDSNREGTFTMLAGGSATVRIYPEYNEGIAKTIVFNVHEHDYQFESITDGMATIRCSCGDEKQVTAPTTQYIKYLNTDENYYYDLKSKETVVGEEYIISSNVFPNGCEKNLVVEISDPSVASYEATSNTRGKLTMLAKGTTTVRFYQKYNPSVYNEYTFDVDTHAHNYEWQGTENDIATFKCSLCDKAKQADAPTYISPSWYYNASTYVNVKTEDEIKAGSYNLYYGGNNMYGMAGGCEVEISDSNIATFTQTSATSGIIEFTNSGNVTITFFAKYNPTVRKTYTLYASDCTHEYEWQGTENNIATFRCSLCEHEKQVNMPVAASVYWKKTESIATSVPPVSEQEIDAKHTILIYQDSNYDDLGNEYVVEISDDEIISCVSDLSESWRKSYELTMLKPGTATVTVYPKYNPAVAKTFTFTVLPPHEHDYTEWTGTEEGMATFECECGETTQIAVPASISVSRNDGNAAGELASAYELTSGDTIGFKLTGYAPADTLFGSMVVETSDASIVSYTPASEDEDNTEGTLTMHAAGSATVKIYPYYNEAAAKTITFTVLSHEEHDYKFVSLANGIATIRCICGDERQVTAPTSQYVFIRTGGAYESINPYHGTEECVIGDVYDIDTYLGPQGCEGAVLVEISDPSVASFEATGATSGKLTMLAKGSISVKVGQKYNPNIYSIYYFDVDDHVHDYELMSNEGSYANIRCSICGKEEQVYTPSNFSISWYDSEDEYVALQEEDEIAKGSYEIGVYPNSTSRFADEHVVEISDSSIATFTPDSKTYGTIEFVSEGEVTVTIYLKYNPSVSKTYTLTVYDPHEHDYSEWTGTEEGMATFECECGETTQIAVPTSISVSRNDGNEAGELASAYELTIGDTLGFKLTGYAPADTLFGSMVVKTSDESVVSYTPASEDDDNTEGTLTMHAAGSATVKIYPYYNEAAAKTITFTVLPHEEHDYQFVSARKGIATWRCICGDERQIAVPTSQTVTVQNGTTYWEPSNYEEGLECVVGDVCDISIKCYPANVENIVCVEISDPSIASYEATGNSTGRLKLNSKGVVCVTFSQKYDPDMRKTAYFYVDDHAHDYVLQSVEEGYAVIICSICDRERHVNVPSSMGICWYDSQDNDLNIQDEADIEIGRYKINVYTDFLPHLGDEHVVEISDSSIATFTYDSDKSGTIEFVKGGTVTVTIYLKYNPSVRKTYTLTVYDPHEHDYQYSYTNEYGYAIFTCECGETEAVRVPTYVFVGWYDEEGDSYESSPAVTWETGMQTEFIYSFYPSIYESNEVNTEFVINISNPDVMSIEECGDAENGDYRYKVNMLAQGETTLTIYPKYNPDLAQTFNFTVIQHEHDYSEWTGTADGVATFKCECGETTQVSVPTSITVNRVDERGLYVPIEESYECLLEDTLEIYTVGYSPSNTRFGRMIVDISDSSIVSYTPQSTHESNKRGTLTMLAGGTATVRVYPEFNEAAAVSFDITVIPHKHDYKLVGIDDSGIATIRCSCGDEKRVVAPYTQWSILTLENRTEEITEELGFSNNLIGDVYDITSTVYSHYCEALNVVEISDPSVASYEATGKTSGKLTLLAKGTTTVRIYQRYNPSLSEEFTFEVDDHIHDYVWQGAQNNYATFKCSICDKVRETYIPDNITSSMYDNDAYFYDIQRENDVKKKIYTMYTYFDEYDGLAGGFNVEVSDNSIATYTAESMQSGTIEFIDNGEVTVTFTAKYNPDAIRTYKFYVSDCEHEYEVVNAENDIVYLRCGLCGHEREDDLTLEPALSLSCDDDNFEAAPHNIIMNKGDFINYRLTHNYLHDEYIVTSDDSDVVYIDGAYGDGYFPEYEGSFNAENEGSAVITIINKNCPSISCTYNITVLGESNLPEFKISRATLKLENNISIVFKADAKLAEVYHDMYIEVEQEIENGQKIKKRVDGTLSADGSFYEFVYTGVNAKAVGDNLDITIFGYDTEGNLIQGGTKTGYSVKQYCMSMLSKDDDYFTSLGFVEEKTEALKTLLVDLLNYASEAQNYFEYKTDYLANAELSEEQAEYASDDSVLNELINVTNLRQETVNNPQAQWKAASVVLKSKTGIRVKFTYNGDINDIAVVAKPENGAEMRITEFEECGENTYYAYYNELNAYQFDESVDFVVVSGSEKISNTLRYSVESYAARKISSANLEDVVSAMIKYGKSAKVYAFGDFKKNYNANTEEKLIIE